MLSIGKIAAVILVGAIAFLVGNAIKTKKGQDKSQIKQPRKQLKKVQI